MSGVDHRGHEVLPTREALSGGDSSPIRYDRLDAASARSIQAASLGPQGLARDDSDRQSVHLPDDVGRTIRVAILLKSDRALLASAVGVVFDLDPHLQVVAIETSSPGGLGRVLDIGADVILVDDISDAARLREAQPQRRLIVLGVAGDPATTLASIRAGASAYVDQNTSPAELVNVVRRVYVGEIVFEASVLLELLQNSSVPVESRPRRTSRLSDRELEVLSMFAQGANSSEVAAMLNISLNTIRTHLKSILVKLEARSKLEAVIIAIREGRIVVS